MPSWLLICMCSLFLPACRLTATESSVCHARSCVHVEVVSDPAGMAMGLMGRDRLDEGRGMLFVFVDDNTRTFWMKNVRFALDIIWIDHEGKIVSIGEHILPCEKDPCPVYTSDEKARYVLEVPAGYTKKHGWHKGDRLRVSILEK
jgi:uncharacterized protein